MLTDIFQAKLTASKCCGREAREHGNVRGSGKRSDDFLDQHLAKKILAGCLGARCEGNNRNRRP
jgi:hypothetical protein